MERLRRVGVRAFAALGAAAVAATATLVAFTRQGLRDVDQQAKLARSLDATIDGLRGVQIAAADAGVESGALGTSLQMLNARTAEAARGTGSAAQAMERLGLDAQALMRMDVDQRMAAIADRMKELGFSAAQAQDELGQLGIRNRRLALLMIQGGDAIRNARKEVDDYGMSLSEVDASKVERANDAFRRLGRFVEGVRVQLAIQLAGAITVVSDRFNEMIVEAGGIDKVIAPAIENMVRRLGALGDAVQRMAILFATWRLGVAYLRFAFLELNRFISGTFYKTIADIGQAIINLADRISRFPFAPKIDTSGLRDFVNFSDDTANAIDRMRERALASLLEANSALNRLLGDPKPSEEFERLLREAAAAAEEASKNIRRSFEQAAPLRMGPFGLMIHKMIADAKEGTEEIKGFFDNLLESLDNNFQNMDRIAADMINSMTARFGDAFEQMIFDSKSLGEAISQLAETMLRSIVNALGQMAAQWVAYQAVQMAKSKASQATSAVTAAATGTAIAAAYAPAAAAASLASFGANAAPAMAALSSTHALSKVLSLGARERGGPVMSGKPYMVGERGPELMIPHGAGRVVPNNQLGGQSTMVTVNINAEDPGAEGRIRTMVERDMAPQIVQAAVGQTLGRLQRPSFA
jgi:DNA anti-recombination protein RmuC